MKKFTLFLLILVTVVMGVSCTGIPAVAKEDEGAVVQMMDAALLSSFSLDTELIIQTVSTVTEAPPPPIEEVPAEQGHFCEDIPLTYEEQEWLQAACEEFEVPYALALGLIEKETDFRNIVCDEGASSGYMQVQKRWHSDRMEHLGVTDLLEPAGNFRVGCDYLSELYEKHNDWNVALTAYNMGHDPGYVTDYAKEVMDNYARWQELLETYI